RHPDMTPAPQGLAHQEQVARPLTLVLVVLLGPLARADRLPRSHLTEQLPAGFVEAHHRLLWIVRQQVGLEHILHPPDVLPVCLRRDAPGPDYPRIDGVFFRAWRTVSVLTGSVNPSATSSSANNGKVQWECPSGGSLQATRIKACSTSPLILTLSGRGGWGLWSKAARKPSVTKRLRTRETVREPSDKAAARVASCRWWPWESSASNRTRAWASLRAAALPLPTRLSNSARSPSVEVTR